MTVPCGQSSEQTILNWNQYVIKKTCSLVLSHLPGLKLRNTNENHGNMETNSETTSCITVPCSLKIGSVKVKSTEIQF